MAKDKKDDKGDHPNKPSSKMKNNKRVYIILKLKKLKIFLFFF